MGEPFYVSRKKYEALVNELKDLKELKAQLSNEIGEAAAQGDLKENAEYHAAKEKQAVLHVVVHLLSSLSAGHPCAFSFHQPALKRSSGRASTSGRCVNYIEMEFHCQPYRNRISLSTI